MAITRTIERLPTVERDGQAFGRLIVRLDNGEEARVIVQGNSSAVDCVCSGFTAPAPAPAAPLPPPRPPTETQLLSRLVIAASHGDLNARHAIRTILTEAALGDLDAGRLLRNLCSLVGDLNVLRELAR